MTIDISPRQSGKTTRLIEHIVNKLITQPEPILLITNTHHHGRSIKRIILDKVYNILRDDYNLSFVEINRVTNRLRHSCSALPGYNYICIDEFDIIPFNRLRELIPSIRDGYFCSTISHNSRFTEWLISRSFIEKPDNTDKEITFKNLSKFVF